LTAKDKGHFIMQGTSENNFKPLDVNGWLDFTVSHSGLKHYASPIMRPGSQLLPAAIEYQLFPPNTPANENFHANIVEWGGHPWYVFSTPKERHTDIMKVGRELAMRICTSPPAMMFFGQSAMVLTVPPTAKEKDIKAAIIRAGIPKELVDLFSGRDTFPGDVRVTHAVETEDRLLRKPLGPEEYKVIAERESAVIDAMEHGIVPSTREIADFVFGKGRVLSSPRPE
jgi:hypothetical protein